MDIKWHNFFFDIVSSKLAAASTVFMFEAEDKDIEHGKVDSCYTPFC